MPKNSMAYTLSLPVDFASAGLIFCGCALFFPPEPSPTGRGRLSEAMDASADSHTGDRQVADSHERPAVEQAGEERRSLVWDMLHAIFTRDRTTVGDDEEDTDAQDDEGRL